jgi:5-methylcytosine-specific restriction protein B
VPFPRNIWIVGTVNVDETTYMFSPKVLDRANTFEFRVETGDLSADARKPTKCAAGDDELVRGLLSIARDDDWQLTRPSSFADDLIPRLRQLHQLLCRYNLEFGHRVFYEALRFASLAEQAGLQELETVLDRIVMQKVLPRLHGSRRRLELPLLALALYCRDLPESLVSDQKLPTLEVEAVSESGARLPSAHAKVVRMLQNLRLNQFASFTE